MDGMLRVLEAGNLTGFTLEIVLKTTLLLTLATAASWALRRQSAAVRHSVWTMAAVGVLSLPFVAASVDLGVPILPAQMENARSEVTQSDLAQGDVARTEMAPVAQSREASSSPVDAPAEASTAPAARAEAPTTQPTKLGGWDLSQVLFGAWAIVALGLLARIAMGVLSLRRIAKSAASLKGTSEALLLEDVCAEAGVTRPVRLIRSEWSDVPMTWGVIRPIIHLPAASAAWDADRLRVVLEHEVAHVRRWDVLTLGVARAATALHWFNPMAWIAERSLRDESERASDDWVLRWGTMPSAYAEHLLELARGHMPSRLPATALPMAHRSQFEGRLLAILQPEADRRSVSMKNWITAGVVAGLGFSGLAAAVPVSAVAPSDPAPATLASSDESVGDESADNIGSDIGEVVANEQVAAILDEAFAISGAVESARENAVTPQEVTAADRATLEDPRSVAALAKALREDTEPSVRRVAAWALGQIEDRAATEALIAALGADADLEVRKTVVWALGQIEDRRAVPALVGALSDADTDLRHQAAWALGQIESAEAVSGLVDALNDSESEVRQQAIWALGQIESADAVPGLSRMLDDDDPEVRSQAAWALGQIESARATDALVAVLSDTNREVRSQAAWALGQIEDGEAMPGLSRALATDTDPNVRSQIAWAMGQIEPSTAPQALIDALNDASDKVRGQALWAIQQIEDPASVDAVVALLQSDDARTKAAALNALSRIRSQAAIEAIAALMNDESPEVREAAARALAGRGGWANPRPSPRPRPRPRPRPLGNEDAGGVL